MYVAGQWNALCMRCGFKFKSSRIRREWTGLRVCQGCLDHRHPQEFVKGKADRQAPPWTSPEPTDTFIVAQVDWDDL
jgi:hypothetical protein